MENYEEDSRKMADLQESFKGNLNLNDSGDLMEIVMIKEEIKEDESSFNLDENKRNFAEDEKVGSEGDSNQLIEEEKEKDRDDFYDEETEINLDEIKEEKFENRKDLKEKVIKEWGGNKKIKLNFRTEERILITNDTKVSIILCSKKTMLGCPFYLEFRTDAEDHLYTLNSYWNIHNHALGNYDNAHAISEEILESIKSFKGSSKSISSLTKSINKKFEKNFHRLTIPHFVNQLQNKEFGKINEDAEFFMKMLEEDHKQRGGFYQVKINEQTLQGCCYMSKRMSMLLDHFSDVIIIDVSHGTNRFNLPFLDIVIINNYGQTCLCYFSLLPNQQYESFQWSLENFKSKLSWTPKVIFSDDEEALRKGKLNFAHIKFLAIKNIFPRASNFVCSWHVQQNLKKKFCYLNRAKDNAHKKLYTQIVNLPYSNSPLKFEEDMSEINDSTLISSELKKYLKDKLKEKEFWVKGFMKVKFCCGMCSTSRIESKHKTLKQFLNSGKRLTELFKVIKELEQKEISRMENEIEKFHKKERKKQEKNDIIIHFKDIYTDYVIERLKDNLNDSTNYKIIQNSGSDW